jgi:hypothetical protein
VYNQGQVAQAFPTRVTFCPSFNFTMKNQEFFDLVTPPPFETEYVDERVLGAWQTIDKMMREVDVSVTNFGAHYDIVDPDELRGQQRGKYTWGREIQEKRYGYMLHRIQEEKSRRPRSCHYLRETFHQHFPGGSGRFVEANFTLQRKMGETTGEWCIPDATYELDVLNETLLALFPEIPVLNYSTLDRRAAGRFHSTNKGSEPQWGSTGIISDCTHMCWSTRFFDPVWYLLLGALRESCPRM